MTAVTLDRAQREAIRGEMLTAAGDCGDISLALGDRRESGRDREFVVRRMARLQRIVATLDAVGWTEPPDNPEEVTVTVDRELAVWAAEAADELVVSLGESISLRPDADLDALGALRLVAGVL